MFCFFNTFRISSYYNNIGSFTDPATNRVVGSAKVGERPWGVALSADGRTAYTANGPSNDVSFVDLATMKVTATVKVGERPWGVAIVP